MQKMDVLLASGSVQRKAILEELGIRYQAVAMDVDEMTRTNPADTVRDNALLKLQAALSSAQVGQAVIAADTVVLADGQILGKPGTPDQAKKFLKMLSGNAIEAYSGLAVGMGGTKKVYAAVEKATVIIKQLADSEIDWYIATSEPIVRAGAIGITHYGEIFVSRIEGSYSCVAGLPKMALLAILSHSQPLADAVLPVPAPRLTVSADVDILEITVP